MRTLLVTLGLVVGLSACTVQVKSEPTSTPTHSATAPKVSKDTGTDTDKYLSYLVSKDSDFGLVDDNTLLDLGHAYCAALDAGATVEEMVTATNDSGLTDVQVAATLSGAVKYLCPKYIDSVRSQVSGSNA